MARRVEIRHFTVACFVLLPGPTPRPPMDKLVIEGGVPLVGTVSVSGAKNAALPVLIATLLAPGVHEFRYVPDLVDVGSTLSLLGRMGLASLVQPPRGVPPRAAHA